MDEVLVFTKQSAKLQIEEALIEKIKVDMRVIINERSNQDWVLQELQVAYQAKTREVKTWRKAHKALSASYQFAELTFQSELNVIKNEVEEWKKTCQELANAQNHKEGEYKEELVALEKAQAMAVEGIQHTQTQL